MTSLSFTRLLEDAKHQVQHAPSDFAARSKLWQLFAVAGERDRARKQLDMLVHLDSSWALEVQACHGLLTAEDQRDRVLRGEAPPECLGPAPGWLPWAWEMLACVAAGNMEQGLVILAQVREQAPVCGGSVNGQGFEWLCDGDARLGPVLEMIVNGRYFWVPWSGVRSVLTRPPNETRDMLWQHAMVELAGENPLECFLPARYPQPRNDEEAMSRATAWADMGADFYLGYGQKSLMTESSEFGVLEVRSLRFNAEALA